MTILGLLLFVIHIVAFVAGGANSVVMPVIGARMAGATPETRNTLVGIAETLAKIGKYAMATLLVTGLLVLWLKWNWVIPSPWFWAKMGFIVLMIVFISLNEMNAKAARAGDQAAAKRSAMFGQLTAVSFLGVILSAVLAFN
jgi:protoporphyrinogen IX oxidase